MNLEYSSFIKNNKTCAGLEYDATAIIIFKYLCQDQNVISMIDACDAGRPAITPCVKNIENLVHVIKTTSIKTTPTIFLKDMFSKQVVGMMVKEILSYFGYKPYTQKALPKNCGSKEFKSGSVYHHDEGKRASYTIIKKIVKL